MMSKLKFGSATNFFLSCKYLNIILPSDAYWTFLDENDGTGQLGFRHVFHMIVAMLIKKGYYYKNRKFLMIVLVSTKLLLSYDLSTLRITL